MGWFSGLPGLGMYPQLWDFRLLTKIKGNFFFAISGDNWQFLVIFRKFTDFLTFYVF